MRARGHGLRVASGAGEPPNAAPAAKSKDRQTFHRARKSQPVHQLRVETWDGKPCDRIDDERTNIIELDRRRLGRFERHLLEQVKRMALEDGGTRFPSVVLMIPVRRFAQIAVINPGVAIEAFEPREMRENFLRARGNLGLANFVWRHGYGHRRDLNVELGLVDFGPLTLARGLEHVYPGLSTVFKSKVFGSAEQSFGLQAELDRRGRNLARCCRVILEDLKRLAERCCRDLSLTKHHSRAHKESPALDVIGENSPGDLLGHRPSIGFQRHARAGASFRVW